MEIAHGNFIAPASRPVVSRNTLDDYLSLPMQNLRVPAVQRATEPIVLTETKPYELRFRDLTSFTNGNLYVLAPVPVALMGIFFYTHNVALSEDLALDATYTDIDKFSMDVDTAFQQNAINCWIAACIYVVTLCVSIHQFWMNNRSSV